MIDGTMSPPDKQETITVTAGDKRDVLNAMKAKLKARAANKMGYMDLVTSTDGIRLRRDMKEGGIQKQGKIKSRSAQNSSTTSRKTQGRDPWIG